MTRRAFAWAAAWLLVLILYAALSALWTDTDSQWYRGLDMPPFQPPDWVFGVIWPLNYLTLAVVGVLLARAAPDRMEGPLVTFAASVVLALGWSYLFSQERMLLPSAVSLVLAALLTWLLLAQVWRLRAAYGAALVVYAGWMTLAAALSTGYAALN